MEYYENADMIVIRAGNRKGSEYTKFACESCGCIFMAHERICCPGFHEDLGDVWVYKCPTCQAECCSTVRTR